MLGALWVAAAVLATSVGLVAVHLVAGEVGEQVSSPLSDDDVQGALSSAQPTAASPTRSPSPRPSPSKTATPTASARPTTTRTAAPRQGELRTIRTDGGVVGARCVSSEPRLVYASPAEGWRTERSRDDEVRFVRGDDQVRVRMSCSGTALRAVVENDEASPSPSPRESSETPEPEHSDDADETDSAEGS